MESRRAAEDVDGGVGLIVVVCETDLRPAVESSKLSSSVWLPSSRGSERRDGDGDSESTG